MAGISEISLGTLALEDVQGSETLTYDILIPDGITTSRITSATLTIGSGDISTKEVEATHFSYGNFSGDHTVTRRDLAAVTLRLRKRLEAICGSEVHVIHLSDIAAERQRHRSRPHRVTATTWARSAQVTVHHR